MSSEMIWGWKCPVCGNELKIGPAMLDFAPYCSNLKCSYNKDVFADSTNYENNKNEFATADSTTDYENNKEEKHET